MKCISGEPAGSGKNNWLHKGTQKNLGGMIKLFYILIVVVVIYVFLKLL